MSRSNDSTCCYTMCSIITFAFFIVFILSGIEYSKLSDVREGNCYITDVKYPTSLENRSNFIRCSCKGKSCYSDSGICISIYGYFSEDTHDSSSMFHENLQNGVSSEHCTFAEKKCRDGAKIEDRLQKVKEAGVIAKEFIDKQMSNETITCYKDANDNNIYLKNDENKVLITFIVISILFGICLMICVCCTCSTFEVGICEKKPDPSASYAI